MAEKVGQDEVGQSVRLFSTQDPFAHSLGIELKPAPDGRFRSFIPAQGQHWGGQPACRRRALTRWSVLTTARFRRVNLSRSLEKNGFISRWTAGCLNRCAGCRAILSAGNPPINIAVNVSPSWTSQEDFVDYYAAATSAMAF